MINPLTFAASHHCPARLLTLVLISAAAAVVGQAQDAVVAAADGQVLEIYDVRDLAELLGTWSAPESGEARDPDALLQAGTRSLIQTIREECDPPLPFEDDARIMAAGTLVLRASPASHAWVKEMLTHLRTSWATIAQIDGLVYLVEDTAWSALGIAAGESVLAGGDTAEALVARFKSVTGVEVIEMPRLSVYLTQRGMISLSNRTEYIAGWDEHASVLPVAGPLVVPRIEHIDEGLRLDCRVLALKDDRYQVSMKVEQVDLMRPLKTIDTAQGPVLDPVTETRTVSATVALGTGDLVLFQAGERQQRRMLIGIRLAAVLQREPTDDLPSDADK